MSSLHSAELSRALFEEAGDALFLLEPQSDRLLDVNSTAERLSGLARAQLLAQPATYWFRFGGPGGARRLRQAVGESGVFHSQEGFLLRTAQDVATDQPVPNGGLVRTARVRNAIASVPSDIVLPRFDNGYATTTINGVEYRVRTFSAGAASIAVGGPRILGRDPHGVEIQHGQDLHTRERGADVRRLRVVGHAHRGRPYGARPCLQAADYLTWRARIVCPRHHSFDAMSPRLPALIVSARSPSRDRVNQLSNGPFITPGNGAIFVQ